MPSAVYAIATMDTKGDELAFVVDCLRSAGVTVRTVDVSTGESVVKRADVSRESLADGQVIQSCDRGTAIAKMSTSLTNFLQIEAAEDRVAGVIGLGGSGGTSLISAALRKLPIGLPKLMVSTMASGNTAAYVGCSDITMMYSVVDIAGLNVVSQRVLSNAAHAMAGMVLNKNDSASSKPCLGMTMFGVTTACVTVVREALELQGNDCLVFHATGTGGRAMEQLVASGLIEGVLDITTTEVADEVVGGVMPGGPARLDAAIQAQIPMVLSLGALDMVNFGARSSVPSQFQGRNLHEHNAEVTLMRTSVEDNRLIGRWIASKLNRSQSPVTVVIPEAGVSALDAVGMPFYDPAADAALFETLESCLTPSDHLRIVRLPCHINSPKFSEALVDEFGRLTRADG